MFGLRAGPVHAGTALLLLSCLAACTSPVSRVRPVASSSPSASPLPVSVVGSISFSPPTGSTEVDPGQPVVVSAARRDATVTSVTVQPDGGAALEGAVKNGIFTLRSGLVPDTSYTITATATVRAAGSSQVLDTETSKFTTATTPKVVSANPPSLGSGQSVVLALQPPAASISVDGPVRANLGSDGTTVTVVPADYQQGQVYRYTLVAKNLKGVAGAPQPQSFSTLGAATAYVIPDNQASNIGVAMPLTITLSSPPADRNQLASHISVTVDVHQPPAPSSSPSPGSSPGGAGPCASYTNPGISGPIQVTPTWLTATRVRLTPRTGDGYWPANATITLKATLGNLKTQAGNWFTQDLASSFSTGDKRVIDVDLTSQTLTACRNGVQDVQWLVSTGTTAHPSFTGSFYIYRRVADEEMKSTAGPFAPDYYDIKHVPWTQYFDGGAALHGAWWHNNWGHPMSHGCVGLETPTQNTRWPNAAAHAEYLWKFDNIGDPVILHGVTPGLTAAQQPSD
jgi:lipoprotein-anchoring transpeptidase ErfK/SrfK